MDAYLGRPEKRDRWSFNGLRDAFLQYKWNGEAWAANKTVLDAFRCELREAVQTEDVRSVVTICENILNGAAWRRTTCAIYTDSNRFSCVNFNTYTICCRETARRRSAICAANLTIRPRHAA